MKYREMIILGGGGEGGEGGRTKHNTICYFQNISRNTLRSPQTCFRACFLSNPKFFCMAKRFSPKGCLRILCVSQFSSPSGQL